MNDKYDYTILDDLIKNNKESDDIFCKISGKHLKAGKEMYNEMQDSQNISYDIFGSNGQGTTCFGLYKSKEQIIYLIHVSIQDPIGYTIVDVNNKYLFDV